MAPKTATDEDIECLEKEFQDIVENRHGQERIQALSKKITEIEETIYLWQKD